MGDFFLPLLLLLLALAFFFQEPFIFTLIYLFAGAYAAVRWWSSRSMAALRLARHFTPRAFPGETVEVRIDVANPSRLAVIWLHLSESLPQELSRGQNVRQVLTLPPRSSASMTYQVFPRKRGYYRLGPVFIHSGDVLGLFKEEKRQGDAQHLIVYPEVVRFRTLRIPTWSPLGTLRDALPIFEDPARIAGKRAYLSGDPLRRVDWKATAALGQLHVRLLEPSIDAQTLILLDFNPQNYRIRTQLEASELAVVVCASLASWIVERKAPVGFATNALDPLHDGHACLPVPARRGRSHLMTVLELLARLRLGESEPFTALVHRQHYDLPWGATLILVASDIAAELFDEIQTAKRRGIHVMLVLCGAVPDVLEHRRKAEAMGIAFAYLSGRMDLEAWR